MKSLTGVFAFLIVLATMPLGHSVMILMEHFFGHAYVYHAAVLMGLAGTGLLVWGSISSHETRASFLGLFAGLLIWTGWIEFSFVYYANRYQIPPLMENGEVVTKPEYLLMPSSVGFLAVMLLFYLFNSRTGCTFFTWIQRVAGVKNRLAYVPVESKNVAMVTAIELIMLLWTFYLVLLFAYDQTFLGDRHPITYVIAFGSLFWSLYLFRKLARIRKMGYAIRYAIPTVIIFWNFVEIMGRWEILHEIWVEPLRYWPEVLAMVAVLALLTGVALVEQRKMPARS
jgi:hypothetical protein